MLDELGYGKFNPTCVPLNICHSTSLHKTLVEKRGFLVDFELREQWDVLGCPFLHPLQQLHPPPYLLRQVLQKLIHGQETVKSIYLHFVHTSVK